MLTPEALTLSHWLSPAFPTGAFAYSHGLEQVVARGEVVDAIGLEHWLAEVLHFGTGWQDAVLLSMGLQDGADFNALDALSDALQTCSERQQETREQGLAFARIVSQTTGRDLPPRGLPLAVAEAAASLSLPRAFVIATYLQAFLTNLVTIAIRHVPLGQGEGHTVLARLLAQLPEIAEAAASANEADAFGNSCFAADIAAMEHETKEVRLFRT